jgi:hypothetical protein
MPLNCSTIIGEWHVAVHTTQRECALRTLQLSDPKSGIYFFAGGYRMPSWFDLLEIPITPVRDITANKPGS